MTTTPKNDQLDFLHTKLLENGAGELYGAHVNVVFGTGNPDADLVVIGEAPGDREDKQKEPFVGPSGQLLEKIFKKLELSREDVYITNVVKKRPPGNRTPSMREMELHAPYLYAELAVVQPKVIVTLGRTATAFVTVTEGRMGALRKLRRLRYFDNKHDLVIPVVATWHPSYVLRSLSEDNKQPLREMALDVKRAAIMMAKAGE